MGCLFQFIIVVCVAGAAFALLPYIATLLPIALIVWVASKLFSPGLAVGIAIVLSLVYVAKKDR